VLVSLALVPELVPVLALVLVPQLALALAL
jgi:hypothetical protein